MGLKGLIALQKCTAILHVLVYRMAEGSVNEYNEMGKSINLGCLKRFYECIISCCKDEFLCPSNIDKTDIFLKHA